MADKYILLRVIKVNRGMIESCKKNGEPVMAQHQPYWAGVVIMNMRSYTMQFLDEYNAPILLNRLLELDTEFGEGSLNSVMRQGESYLKDRVYACTVKDLNVYLKGEHIRRAGRDAERMKSLAKRTYVGVPGTCEDRR